MARKKDPDIAELAKRTGMHLFIILLPFILVILFIHYLQKNKQNQWNDY